MSEQSLPFDIGELYRRLDAAEQAFSGTVSAEARARILLERAREVAEAPLAQAKELAQALVFRLGGERFAVPLAGVDQVLELRGLTPLPGVAPHVLGVMLARSTVLTIVDLRRLLELSGGGMADLKAVVGVRVGNERFGLVAEEVEGQIGLPERVQPAVPVPSSIVQLVEGIAVLDLSAVLAQASAGARTR